jgi:RNA polymerase sigma factor (TIGR02999 family)
MSLMTNLTLVLHAIESGQASTEDLLPLVYDELRRMAGAQLQHERAGQTLQATALVHEVFLRLAGGEQLNWQNRRHFFGAAALAMQRILVEQARRRQQLKRGGNLKRVDLIDTEIAIAGRVSDSELLAIHEAFGAFEKEEPNKAELVRLRYFVGLTEEEAAKTLNISRATASRWWTFSRAWLFQRIQGSDAE